MREGQILRVRLQFSSLAADRLQALSLYARGEGDLLHAPVYKRRLALYRLFNVIETCCDDTFCCGHSSPWFSHSIWYGCFSFFIMLKQ